MPMDPLLAARLSRQRDKELSGENAVDAALEARSPPRAAASSPKARSPPSAAATPPKVGLRSFASPRIAGQLSNASSPKVFGSPKDIRNSRSSLDPALARLLARQQQKLLDAESPGSEAKFQSRTSEGGGANVLGPGLDPVLARRLARQQEKVETGESAVDGVGAGRKTATALDPALALRLARQQEKVITGESATEGVKSATATSFAGLDPLLARRFGEQQRKERTGESAVDLVASPCRERIRAPVVADPELAARLERQRALAAAEEAEAAALALAAAEEVDAAMAVVAAVEAAAAAEANPAPLPAAPLGKPSEGSATAAEAEAVPPQWPPWLALGVANLAVAAGCVASWASATLVLPLLLAAELHAGASAGAAAGGRGGGGGRGHLGLASALLPQLLALAPDAARQRLADLPRQLWTAATDSGVFPGAHISAAVVAASATPDVGVAAATAGAAAPPTAVAAAVLLAVGWGAFGGVAAIVAVGLALTHLAVAFYPLPVAICRRCAVEALSRVSPGRTRMDRARRALAALLAVCLAIVAAPTWPWLGYPWVMLRRWAFAFLRACLVALGLRLLVRLWLLGLTLWLLYALVLGLASPFLKLAAPFLKAAG